MVGSSGGAHPAPAAPVGQLEGIGGAGAVMSQIGPSLSQFSPGAPGAGRQD